MTYEWKGRQFVVIAAGGHADLDVAGRSDTFVAFALPKPGEATGTFWSRRVDKPGGRMWINFGLIFLGALVVVGGGWWLIKRLRRR
ncbi:MAG: hypothetical protein HOP13_15980 [Alphaproteobacteria bacterium]|nr:hypothetical protein [Alphaproteobacteria bacterium]